MRRGSCPSPVARRAVCTLFVAAAIVAIPAQEVSLEYRVKAAYLYNFIKFVEWPEPATGPLLVCVAGQNPFGTVLADLVRNERVRGVPVETRVILEPDPECDVLFAPRTSNVAAYLRAAAGTPTLTVGETARFIEQGGIIRLFPEGLNVRFEINREAAERARLRISSRLLQLARVADTEER